MRKPKNLDAGDWNRMVDSFHEESDRGAAILAGSFLENALGSFLLRSVADAAIAEKLFGAVGPLSSFSQRIAVAYAFRLISKGQYQDLEAIRQVRNHFAHHPLDATFSDMEVQKHTSKLRVYNDPGWETPEQGAERHKTAYLLGCGFLVDALTDPEELKRLVESALQTMEERRSQATV